MNFILKDDVHKMFDDNEVKLTFYSEESEEKMLVLTELTAIFFNTIEYGRNYSIDECVRSFLEKNEEIEEKLVRKKFEQVISSFIELKFTK